MFSELRSVMQPIMPVSIKGRNGIGSRYLACLAGLESLSSSAFRPWLSIAHTPHRLKCDRQVPCVSCSKRGDEASCAYSHGGATAYDRREGGYRDTEAQLRLQKLEEMVTSLMPTTKEDSHNRRDNGPLHHEIDDQRLSGASIYSSPPTSGSSSGWSPNVNSSERAYVSATHWTTILENVGVASSGKFEIAD